MAKPTGGFRWRPGSEPPRLESHSDAKLRLLRAYLDRYFDVVCALPQMDVLRIALVDTFAGGGMFRYRGAPRPGSPLVMIDAVKDAEARVRAERRKSFDIDARFFFVDEDADAIKHLRQVLREDENAQAVAHAISVRNAASSDALPSILKEIANWSRAGRSIFFLDQCGYSDVPNRDVRSIYQSLPKSEIIVTYNFGAIYQFMNDSAEFLTATAPIELPPDRLREILKERKVQGGRYFAGRLLGQHLKASVGSQFASRFFLRSEIANRDMWFVHYSKITKSRLVMNEAHWAIKNASITQGEPGLDMLGFRPNWEDQIGFDFEFQETDEGQIHTALMCDLPHWLEQFDENVAPTKGELLARTADKTAATEQQIDNAFGSLHNEGVVEILTPSGVRKRPDALLRPSHRILLPRQRRLFF